MAKKLTTEEFIVRSNEKHGFKYGYSNLTYINSDSKVSIICHVKDINGVEHGLFEQDPTSHLQGHGCNKCGFEKVSEIKLKKIDINEFIEKANKIHSNKYTYEKVNYINSETKVTINCLEHGEFEQLIYNHLNGHGCPKCGNSTISDKKKKNKRRIY